MKLCEQLKYSYEYYVKRRLCRSGFRQGGSGMEIRRINSDGTE